jgi:L-ascorbate metabolism protein UlaG (beta-lactamase superfamily)
MQMERIDFLKHLFFIPGIYKAFFSPVINESSYSKVFKIRLLRNATLVVKVGDMTLLVDPLLGKKDSMDPVKNAANTLRIPMVELPIGDEELKTLLSTTDVIFVTHTHRDHWDVAAQEQIPKDKKIFCQPADEEKIRSQGFSNVQAIPETAEWNGLVIHRTNGQHGTGDIGKLMAPVSGYVLQYKKETLYIAGDTIWCADVEQAIQQYQPHHIVVNAGGAQFLTGGPIIMNADDVIKTARAAKKSNIIAVHMEAINHCYLKRVELKEAVSKAGLKSVQVPADGEWV